MNTPKFPWLTLFAAYILFLLANTDSAFSIQLGELLLYWLNSPLHLFLAFGAWLTHFCFTHWRNNNN